MGTALEALDMALRAWLAPPSAVPRGDDASD
jgi:hypothetical protein